MAEQPRTGALTANHRRVFDALRASDRPLTAYEILDRLRDVGITAPPTVYRALQRLIREGLAHRLESLNAFVACAHPSHDCAAAFAICDSCGSVTEIADDGLDRQLVAWARQAAFSVESMTVELRGRCAACAGTGTGAGAGTA